MQAAETTKDPSPAPRAERAKPDARPGAKPDRKAGLRGRGYDEQAATLAPDKPRAGHGGARQGHHHHHHHHGASLPTEGAPIDVPTDAVRLGTLGGTPADLVSQYIDDLMHVATASCLAATAALANFTRIMQFGGATDAKAQIAKTVWTEALSQVWAGVKSGLVAGLAGAGGPVIGAEIGLLTALEADAQRAREASLGQSVLHFLNSINTLMTDGATGRIRQLATLRGQLTAELESLGDPDTRYQVGDAVVMGEQARFLQRLAAEGAGAIATIPRVHDFEAELLPRWVAAASGGVQTVGQHWAGASEMHENGKIEVRMGSGLGLESVRLYVNNRPAETVELLRGVMQSGHKHIYELGIPVSVMLRGPSPTGNGSEHHTFAVNGRPDPSTPGSWSMREMQERWRLVVYGNLLDRVTADMVVPA